MEFWKWRKIVYNHKSKSQPQNTDMKTDNKEQNDNAP